MVRAAIDVGSNSVLLLVARFDDGIWVPFYEDTRVTGLGEGTKTSGLLSEEGMQKTLDALDAFFAKAKELGAEEIRAGATMAARIATNTTEFLKRAKLQRTPVEILSGDEEAELGFLAVAEDPAFDAFDRISIVDVGGQSTEIVTAVRGLNGVEREFAKSFSIGTLGLRDKEGVGGTLDNASLFSTSMAIDSVFDFAHDVGQAGVAVALGATGTNLITIREKMLTWDSTKVHKQWLDFEEVSRAAGWLCSLTDEQRAEIPGLEKGRERSIHLGALILERALYALRVEGTFVSVRGWRHAWLERF